MAILGLNLASCSTTVVTPTVSNTTDVKTTDVKTTAPTLKDIKTFEDLTQILRKDFSLSDLKNLKPKLEEALKNNTNMKEFKVTKEGIEFITKCLEEANEKSSLNKFGNTFFSNQWTFSDTCSQASLERNQNETEEDFKKRQDGEKIICGKETPRVTGIIFRYVLIFATFIAVVVYILSQKKVDIGQQIIQ